jgi:hypothetical protein
MALVAAGAAQARSRGFHAARSGPVAHGHGFRAPRAARKARDPASGLGFARPHKAGSETHRRRAGAAEIKDLGPTTFQPVKRYKGFSYLNHETHPEPEN